MTPDTSKLLQERFPFLTIVSYMDYEYIGIMQNADNNFVSMYMFDQGFTHEMKTEFLHLGETWWWESNRTVPINLFLGKRFSVFKPWLKTFAKKETTIIAGPSINVMDLINKKLKKRTIQLVKS